ncbi:MAG TPA: hypothetical protein VHT27_09950 [Solirubrobacteraceae bacterium]|nr:hypothetical protein [Solirubrobacteraceae bacterium]
MSPERPSARRLLARLWTGSAAHLLGGGLDVAAAFARYAIARARDGSGAARSS